MFPISLFICSVSLTKKSRKQKISVELVSRSLRVLWGCFYLINAKRVIFLVGFGFNLRDSAFTELCRSRRVLSAWIWLILQIIQKPVQWLLEITNSPGIRAHFCCCKQSLLEETFFFFAFLCKVYIAATRSVTESRPWRNIEPVCRSSYVTLWLLNVFL